MQYIHLTNPLLPGIGDKTENKTGKVLTPSSTVTQMTMKKHVNGSF